MKRSRGTLAAVLGGLVIFLNCQAQQYPVVVTPGTPSIWSMEQAHYLLNRLRANNDSVQTKAPDQNDLDPNAVNAIRLDALQTTLNVSAAMNSVTGRQNQIALQQFSQNTARHDEIVRQQDALRAKLYADQSNLATLKGQQARLQALLSLEAAKNPAPAAGAAPSSATVALNQALADISGRATALDEQNKATNDQLAGLDKIVGTAPGSPDLKTVDPPATLAPPDKLLTDSVNKLLSNTVNGFGPKLQASIVLDNFLQMQYEIVAKQLTSLRDEAGPQSRILFLEMPTSISSADRKRFGVGGEDKLAQSWWRVKKIYRRYKTEESPCWLGDDFNDRGGQVGSAIPVAATSDYGVGGRSFQLLKIDNDGSTQSAEAALGKEKVEVETRYQELVDFATQLRSETNPTDKMFEDVELIKAQIRKARAEFRKSREEFLAGIPPLHKSIPYEEQSEKVGSIEKQCRVTRAKYGFVESQLSDLESSVARLTDQLQKTPDDAVKTKETERVAKLQKLLKKISFVLSDQLGDALAFNQAEIYSKLGGPKQVATAFESTIEGDHAQETSFGSGSGQVRAVDLIPRQTALNVNTSHALVRNSALSGAWQTLFGFGLKVDYQRQHETYDQFMQQEVFASGFGKGQATFGWTFGPLPGTHVLNSGARNTYAVLTVPDDTTALELEGYGCAFHRKDKPPDRYPGDIDDRYDYHCGNKLSSLIQVPDRKNSGGFWLSDVEYQPVDDGQHVSLILRGAYFSPQTTVLVNGRRLPQVLGVGKPILNMDSGAADAAEDGVVTGTFEYVNREQLALALNIPKKYDGADFPAITLVAPSRAVTINWLPLRINGKFSRLSEEHILNPAPEPPFAIDDWQFFGGAGTRFTAHLRGHKLTELNEVRLNGEPCTPLEKLNNTMAKVTCTTSEQPDWELMAMTGETDPAKRRTSRKVFRNPLQISITSFEVLDGIQYDDQGHPSIVPVRLIGSGFTPRTALANPLAERSRLTLSYVNPTELYCEIRNPHLNEVVSVSQSGIDHVGASIRIPRPKDYSEPKAETIPKETTVTTVQSEKKVVKK